MKNQRKVSSPKSRRAELSRTSGETDVTQQWSTDDMVETALEEFGQLDVLVNNAGVGRAEDFKTLKNPSVDDWQSTFDVNVFGIVNGTQSVESYMVDRGYGKS
jgi:NADP-dependent 3-hydroxy acid dehydrogenase YdfG